jgi:limonene-1,2-epoxide hydrolase
MSDNLRTVESFIQAWNDIDLDAIMAYFASDAVYHNIPMEEARGVDAIRSLISGFLGRAKTIDWQVHHIAETSGGAVMTERTDRFEVGDSWIEIQVMGIFELTGGRITAWRDYFDLAQYRDQMSG